MPEVATPDGARIAFDILGNPEKSASLPIVLVSGMSSVRGDWNRLSRRLAQTRLVLVYDHRGMGESKLPSGNDKFTIETLASDLAFLINHVGWQEMGVCGFSMGGAVTQQLLILSHPFAFKVTHVILAATFNKSFKEPGFGLPLPPNRVLSEQDKRDFTRLVVEKGFDQAWLKNPANSSQLDELVVASSVGRPRKVILRQMKAANHVDFTALPPPNDTLVLVIHGALDSIVPPRMGNEFLARIPWARSLVVDATGRPGTVPSLDFGHTWFEYFPVRVWQDVIDDFLASTSVSTSVAVRTTARL